MIDGTPPWANSTLRIERSYEHAGLRYRIVEEPRARYPAKPIRRTRMPASTPSPDGLLTRLDPERAAMAERLLREGGRGWRRWSTVRRAAGPAFSPILAETELLDDLCREGGLIVEDVWRNDRWVPNKFMVHESLRPWLGIYDPEALRRDLAEELTRGSLRTALEMGPPRGFDWRSFAFVLRAAERLLDLAEHGIRPGARELAGLVDHTKAWTPSRVRAIEALLGKQFDDLVARQDRQIAIRGPVQHAEGGLWASAVGNIDIAAVGEVRGAILVENAETFRSLLPLAEERWILLHVPGGPPPAEAELVYRLAGLIAGLRIHAAFDPDPAGIRIALVLEKRTGVALVPTGMTPTILETAPRKLPLTEWDRQELDRLRETCGAFEPLRAAIEAFSFKAEQETFQRELLQLFRSM